MQTTASGIKKNWTARAGALVSGGLPGAGSRSMSFDIVTFGNLIKPPLSTTRPGPSSAADTLSCRDHRSVETHADYYETSIPVKTT